MKKIILTSLISFSYLLSSDLQNIGVETTYYNPQGEEKSIVIKREKPSECLSVKFSPKVILGENLTSNSVPSNCKKSIITYMGKVSPMKFSDKVETVGELEVLEFIEKTNENEKYLLIDSRGTEWYLNQTIPSAINIPYIYSNKSQYPAEFEEMLDTLDVEIVDGKYDFKNAKEILLFCNGAWCGQSPIAMKNLIKIGYPEEKMRWYRGGIQSWLSLGFPTIKPE